MRKLFFFNFFFSFYFSEIKYNLKIIIFYFPSLFLSFIYLFFFTSFSLNFPEAKDSLNEWRVDISLKEMEAVERGCEVLPYNPFFFVTVMAIWDS